MNAVAERASTSTRSNTTPRRRQSTRGRVKRRRRMDFRRFSSFLMASAALLSLFGYVSVYAHVKVTGYNRSRLMDQCREERIRNERLQLRYNTLTSPNHVVMAAERVGMVYATRYDYLQKNSRVASAKTGND